MHRIAREIEPSRELGGGHVRPGPIDELDERLNRFLLPDIQN